MRTFKIEVTEAIARRWERLAAASGLPTDVWMAFCLHTCERLELPVTQVLFRIPPLARREAGAYWEVARFERSRCVERDGCGQQDLAKDVRKQLEEAADYRRRLHALGAESNSCDDPKGR